MEHLAEVRREEIKDHVQPVEVGALELVRGGDQRPELDHAGPTTEQAEKFDLPVYPGGQR